MRTSLRALALGALLAAQGARAGDDPWTCPDVPALPARLAPCSESVQRMDVRTLVFPSDPKLHLLDWQLRISGIDPKDIGRTLDAYNRRSELATVRRDGVAIAPYLLRDFLDMPPDQLLQVRVGSWNARLVFQVTWR